MIPKEVVDRIFETAVIEEVIGEFVHLKKAGSSYKAKSPFTDEKTPSFFVVPHKGIYKCFSSGKGGNVVNFLMEYEKMTYPEALRWLADKYGIEIPEIDPTPEELERQTERDSLAILTQFAEKYFEEQLHETDAGKAIGLSYFRERGFREDIIKKFKLGYCQEHWDAFTKHALDQGYELKFLLKSGLSKEKNGSSYDFFRGRVIFPIHNISGKVIAFGARSLKSGKGVAKYFNSPESDLYNKSKALYGIDLAKTAILRNERCYIVEGYTDVISLHQAGVENVVASAGTALTSDQIKMIKRFSPNITVLFDGDAAGIKASFRSIDLILQEGMNVRVVMFPDGQDPDSFAKAHSSTEVQEFLEKESKDFIVFKTEVLAEEAAGDPVKKGGLIRDVVSSIALIPDAIQRSVYLKECSTLLDIDERIINQEINKALRTKNRRTPPDEIPVPEAIFIPPEQPRSKKEATTEDEERHIVRLLFNYGCHTMEVSTLDEEEKELRVEICVSEFLLREIKKDELTFDHPIYHKVLEIYGEHLEDGEFPDERIFINHEDQEIASLFADLITSPHDLSHNWTQKHRIYPETEDFKLLTEARDRIRRLRLKKIQKMIESVNSKMQTDELPHTELEGLMKEKIKLDQAKSKLSSHFGITIIS